MLKQALLYSLFLVLLASCASLKTAFTGKQQTTVSGEQKQSAQTTGKPEIKFLDQDMRVEETKTVPEPAPVVAPKQNVPVQQIQS